MTDPQFGEAEYLCYQVIKQVREQYGESWDLPKTKFNKLCYIADRELREERIDVELPVHWYQYGGVVTTDAMEGGFYDLVDQRWEDNKGQSVVPADGVDSDDFAVDDQLANEIEEKAGDLVNELGGHYGISIAQDYQYEEYAPNDFVRCLHEFRDFLNDLDEEDSLAAEEYVGDVDVSFQGVVSGASPTKESSKSPSEETNSQIRDYLDQLISEYPEDQYSRMEDQFLEWENLSWQMAKNGFYRHLYDFMESFWTAFSRVELRVKHNRNVPLPIRSRWKRQIPEEVAQFESEVESYRNIVIENREGTEVLDMVADSYSDTVRDLFDEPIQEN
jgi:hypothetical protein